MPGDRRRRAREVAEWLGSRLREQARLLGGRQGQIHLFLRLLGPGHQDRSPLPPIPPPPVVFEDRVYYTDWETDGVNSVNTFDGGDAKKVMQKVTTPMTVRIYHQQTQTDLENKCMDSGCEENSLWLTRAVYRGQHKKEEKNWHGSPFACLRRRQTDRRVDSRCPRCSSSSCWSSSTS